MNFAIIKTGGKQYKVAPGETIEIEKLEGEPASQVVFGEVLLIAEGDSVQLGTPLIAGAKITGELVKTVKGKKVIVFRYKPKKRVRVKRGHRQLHTKVKIGGMKKA